MSLEGSSTAIDVAIADELVDDVGSLDVGAAVNGITR